MSLDVARAAGGQVRDVVVVPAAHPVENMTTAALHHVRATLDDGRPFRAFVKELQPADRSPLMAAIPAQFHEAVLSDLCWLDEPRVYRSALARGLPDGLRLPELLHLEEAPDRIVLWLEDVAHRPWQADDAPRAARLLGRMSARWPEERAVAELGLGRRSLRGLLDGRTREFAVPALTGLAGSGGALAPLAADLLALVDVAADLVTRIDAAPQHLAHGDACAANLLVEPDGGFVAVDLSYAALGPLGADLAQLVAGEACGGRDVPSAAGADALVEAYLSGLADEGMADEGLEAAAEEVELGFATHLLLRSGFTAVVEATEETLPARAALTELAVARARRVAATADHRA